MTKSQPVARAPEPAPVQPEPLLRRAYSVDDLLQMYPFSKGYWWGEIRSGKLRATRFSRRVVVMAEDLAAYETQRKVESARESGKSAA
jgi:hypothetical protein